MKMMIQLVLVALIFGGVSAGGSFYYHMQQAKLAAAQAKEKADADEKAKSESSEEKTESVESADDMASAKPEDAKHDTTEHEEVTAEASPPPISFGPPAGVRPPFDPDGDEAGELIYKLRVRSATATQQEQRIQEREEAMKLIVADIRTEQASARKVQKRILDEQKQSMRYIDAAHRSIETERSVIHDDLNETRRLADEKVQSVLRDKDEAEKAANEAVKAAREELEELRKQKDALRKPVEVRDRSGSPEAIVNLKKTVKQLDSMPPEDTAKIMKELVRKGRTEGVVAMLNSMTPRISAKVISAIRENDDPLAADLVERLNRLKQGGDPVETPLK